VTTGNKLARSTRGRAGIHPRRKRTLLRPSTACACLAARWRADPPAQSPHYDVGFRAWPTRSLPAVHPISNSQPRRLEPIATHRKQTTATRSNSQLWPLLVSAFRQPLLAHGPNSSCQPLATSFQPPDSNRPYGRLEINISPTKQRTEVLSNRPKSGVFLTQDAGSPPLRLWRACGMPAVRKATARRGRDHMRRRKSKTPAGCRRYERQRRGAGTGRIPIERPAATRL
jgi:hypothetical protein